MGASSCARPPSKVTVHSPATPCTGPPSPPLLPAQDRTPLSCSLCRTALPSPAHYWSLHLKPRVLAAMGPTSHSQCLPFLGCPVLAGAMAFCGLSCPALLLWEACVGAELSVCPTCPSLPHSGPPLPLTSYGPGVGSCHFIHSVALPSRCFLSHMDTRGKGRVLWLA